MDWETIWEVISHPFTLGFLLGLVLTFFTWKSGVSNKRQLKKDLKRVETEKHELETHLNTQLKINASGNDAVQEKLEKLQQQNENLRVNIASLENKPGRSELRQLHTMETAIRVMREQAPGFASAWEVALRQAETEYEEATSGFRKLVRKVISLPGPSEHSEQSNGKKKDPDD